MAFAYASLVGLFNIVMHIKNHPRVSAFFDNNQIQYLVENAEFLLDFVQSYSSDRGAIDEEAQILIKQVASLPYFDLHTTSVVHFMDHQYVDDFLYRLDRLNSDRRTTNGVGDLERLIHSVADAAEYLIENYIQDQIVAGNTQKKRLAFLLDLHKLIVYMDFLKEKVMKVKNILGLKEKQPTFSMSAAAASSRRLTTAKTNYMAAFNDELIQLQGLLMSEQPQRKVISIVGMGGIGKTTLARNAFESLLIKENFDLCLWATISQESNVRKILLQLLSFKQREFTSETMHELGDLLYKSLYGRRYLIVLDDMWDIDVWDRIKVFLPDNGNKRSGIAITTRLSNVASHCSSTCIRMKFLDKDKNWKLFCNKTFGEEYCPDELEEIGKEIVMKCRGLPLSIVVIGGHLKNSLRIKECWLEVAKDINSILNSRDQEEHCFSILALSYNHLHTHLKLFFLIIELISKEDEKIHFSNIALLWTRDGLLKQNEMLSSIEFVHVCLNDLFDRNLIEVYARFVNGEIQTFKIHDRLRDLCIRVNKKEKLLCALKLPPQDLKNCSSPSTVLKIELYDTFTIENEDDVVYPRTKIEHVCLRYLNCTIYKTAPCLFLHSSISLLWNLQILIIKADENVQIMAPSEFWEMPNLRILKVSRICVPNPPSNDHQQDDLILHNLQTLSVVYNFRLSEEVCKRIPNIESLQLCYDGEASSSFHYCLHNLCCFKQLKYLLCNFKEMQKLSDSALNLPSSLLSLNLRSHYLDWEDLTMIAMMVPHLNTLVMQFWDSNIGQFKGKFPCLKALSITGEGDFVEWNVDEPQFPVLEYLELTRYGLVEIPPGILEIPTLKFVNLKECSASAAISALKILVEQEELGNEGFKLGLTFWTWAEEERFLKMKEEED